MKLAHNIKITVFSKPEDDEEQLKKALLSLFSFDLLEEKIELKTQKAQGFNERKIKIMEVILIKERHTSPFLKNLLQKLDDKQKDLLNSQKESRLDDKLSFYIRLDKTNLLEGKYFITEFGDCFHIKLSIAAFPSNREAALKVIEKMLTPE